MRALVACEYSGRVRDALAQQGVDAMSCDLLPSDVAGNHYQGDVRDVLDGGWDLVIAHPPCTYLSHAATICLRGVCAHPGHGNAEYVAWRHQRLAEAMAFFELFLQLPVVAVENPVMGPIPRARFGRPTQYVQPWQFGDPWTKRTGLWIRGLPPLEPTGVVEPVTTWLEMQDSGSSATRAHRRSLTPMGLATAMATQWVEALRH